MHKDFHVFFSYARRDNGDDQQGWVTHFHDALVRHHKRTTNRKLETFFDRNDIDAGERWKFRLGEGLRRSRLFLAFTSQNYLESEVCRWEWEQYLMLEHSAARGDDGVIPIFFVPLSDLQTEGDAIIKRWAGEITERHIGNYCDIAPWFNRGAEALAELDAEERLKTLNEVDKSADQEMTLAERLAAVDLRICRRLDRISLADQVIGNINRSYVHFRGRHAQLRKMHQYLIEGPSGQVVATHGLGGLGKSALARQYAVAYADFYAAGGVWEIPCAGKSHLGDALVALSQESALRAEGLNFDEMESRDADHIAASAFLQLKRITEARREKIAETLHGDPMRRTPDPLIEDFGTARCLLILDNVDDHRLLAADQLKLMPAAPWLEIIVTTRVDPQSLGVAGDRIAAVEVPPLSAAEGLELLRSFMPGEEFPSVDEWNAAAEIVRLLGGYTLSLELVGASLNIGARRGLSPTKYLQHLKASGLSAIDQLADNRRISERIQHEQRRVGAVLDDTLSALRTEFEREGEPEFAERAMQVLRFASLMQPDAIPKQWLEALVTNGEPGMSGSPDSLFSPWPLAWDLLQGLELLKPAMDDEAQAERDRIETVRMHRLVSAHIHDAIDGSDEYEIAIDKLLFELTQTIEANAERGVTDELSRWHGLILDQARHRVHEARASPSEIAFWVLQTAATWQADLGSLSRALDIQSEVVDIRQSYLQQASDLDTQTAARDLSVSQTQLGDFHLRRGQAGDADTALAYFEAALVTAERLARDNPDSAQAARDLSVSQERLGSFYLQRRQPGDTDTALAYFEAALATRQRLFEANPDSAQAASDLSALQNDLGDFHLQRGQTGDADTALAYFEAALAITSHLSKHHPENNQAASDLSFMKDKVDSLKRPLVRWMVAIRTIASRLSN